MIPYLPKPEYQIDGSAYGPLNCVAATGTIITDRASVGRFRFPSRRIRAASGDTVGGIEYGTLSRTVAALTGGDVQLEVRWLDSRAKFRDLIGSGRAAGVIIHCSVTRWTERATGTFTGLHSVAVNRYLWRTGACQCEKHATVPHAEMYVEDPGTRASWRWWSMDLLSRAAEKAGGGGIWVIATVDTEGITRTAREKAKFRALPRVDSLAVGDCVPGQKYEVIRTRNGGPWKRADGTPGDGWYRVRRGTKSFVKGEALR